jgi:hypothetical protein
MQAEQGRLGSRRQRVDLGQQASRLVEALSRGTGIAGQGRRDPGQGMNTAADHRRAVERKHRCGPPCSGESKPDVPGDPRQECGIREHRRRRRRVQPDDPLSLGAQQDVSVAVGADPAGHRHDRHRVADVGAQERIVDFGEGLEQSRAAAVGAADRGCECRSVESPGTGAAVLGESRGALEGFRSDAVSSAGDGPAGRTFEEIGDLGIRAHRRRGEVPRTRVRPAVARQRLVGPPPLRRSGPFVGDRLHERMREAEASVVDGQHPRRLGALKRAGFDPEVAACRHHRRKVPIRRGRSHHDGCAVVGPERRKLRVERLEQRRARGRDVVDRDEAEPLVLGQLSRQLAQRQRVPGRHLQNRVEDARGGLGHRRFQERSSVLPTQAGEVEALQSAGSEQWPFLARARRSQ